MVTREPAPLRLPDPPAPMVTRTGRLAAGLLSAEPLPELVGDRDRVAEPTPPLAGLESFLCTWSMVSRSTWAECWSAETSFGQSSISSWVCTPPRPTTVGTEMHTSLIPYGPFT